MQRSSWQDIRKKRPRKGCMSIKADTITWSNRSTQVRVHQVLERWTHLSEIMREREREKRGLGTNDILHWPKDGQTFNSSPKSISNDPFLYRKEARSSVKAIPEAITKMATKFWTFNPALSTLLPVRGSKWEKEKGGWYWLFKVHLCSCLSHELQSAIKSRARAQRTKYYYVLYKVKSFHMILCKA